MLRQGNSQPDKWLSTSGEPLAATTGTYCMSSDGMYLAVSNKLYSIDIYSNYGDDERMNVSEYLVCSISCVAYRNLE